MKLSFAFVLIIFLNCCTSSNNYCGRDKAYSLNEIREFPIYSDVESVKIGSFKLDATTNADRLPIRNGTVDIESFFELKELSKSNQADLLKMLVNLDFSPTGNVKKTVVFCYNPKNAILLFDNRDQVIGYVELSFECFGFKPSPVSLKLGEFCDEKFDAIKNIFIENGIKYGIVPDDKTDQLENLTKQLQLHPNNPIILTSIAKIKIEEMKFSEAIRILDRVVALDSGNRHAYFYRGHSKLMVKDFEAAKDDFDHAVKINPRMTQAYNERAQALIGLFEITQDRTLLKNVCDDLLTVQTLGDSSLVGQYNKYCKN